jgi:hypothetical protein
MTTDKLLPVLAAALVGCAFPVHAQDFPDGPGKETFVALCGVCHDINRSRAGYTPEGWRTVVRMMLNFEVPVPKDQVDTLTNYLIKAFPERERPAAKVIDGPVQAAIKLWPVPTPGSRPHDPRAAADGSIWYTGQLSGRLGRVDPKTGEIKEYPLKTPHTGPHGLAEDKDGNIWFTGNHLGLIGKLDPKERPSDRVQAARPAGERSAHAQLRSGRHPVVHRAAGQYGGPARPEKRRDQARDLADAEIAAVRNPDQLQGHPGVR